MTKSAEKQIKELETKLQKACELIQKQQKAHVQFKSQYIELINLLEKNQNGSFTISNFVEDELIIKGWTTKKDVIVNNQDRIFFALFENASYLMNSKEYFIISFNVKYLLFNKLCKDPLFKYGMVIYIYSSS